MTELEVRPCRDEWALAAGQRLGDPRLLQQYTLDMDYNEYEAHASTTAWCRSAALIVRPPSFHSLTLCHSSSMHIFHSG